jgi:hypothetical protein
MWGKHVSLINTGMHVMGYKFDEAKMDSYELSDAELDKLNELAMPFLESVQREFGSRTTQAMVNVIGAQLSQFIARAEAKCPGDSFYIVRCINEWFAGLARTQGGVPLHLTFDRELGEQIAAKRSDR